MCRYLKLAVVTAWLLALWLTTISVCGESDQEIIAKKNPVVNSDAVLAKARSNFEDNCTPCHGSEGKGDGPLADSLAKRPKDLTDGREMAGLTDGEIFLNITKGRNPMPAFDQKLTDEERWGLVHWLRSLSKTRPNTVPRRP
jgi:mono/diheme cytochrome c family protein